MNLCSQLFWPVYPSCVTNTLTLDNNVHQQFSCLLMLTHTSDLYNFIPFSVILILPGGHKVSAKQNLSALFFHTLSTRLQEI